MLPVIAQVALDLPVPRLFDYLAPTLTAADVGRRVCVPFGRKELLGIVLAVGHKSDHPVARLKPISQVLDDAPILPAEVLKLLQFCSDYYHHPLGATVLSALPTALRKPQPYTLKTTSAWQLTESGQRAEIPARAHGQRALFTLLADGAVHPAASLAAASASYRSTLKHWLELGWVSLLSTIAPLNNNAVVADIAPVLNPEQASAVEKISAATGQFQPFLLHGVTGSGKTEVYLHLVQAALAQGGQVLVLVPEINLTPQLTGVFRARFPDVEIATLNSGMNDGDRLQHWLAASAGRARIVLGTRLAVFTPLPQLALIIIDEEHDSSFYQQDGLRYAARDVAIIRAQQRNIPIMLGSATPALETWHNAQTGRYQRLSLTQRAISAATLPSIRLVDLRTQKCDAGISPALSAAIQQRLDLQQQSLIFINRRGYAPTLVCRACGWNAGCPRCSVRLVVHLRDKQLRCHHCGYAQRVPHACPDCGNVDISPTGVGTQRLEEKLQQQFPTARVLRIDRDSTRRKDSWATMQQQIRAGEVDILIGTQLLAKGHDFPNLTLVGVIDADSALYSPDFRASERLFSQLMQVSGRAGRAQHTGEVLIQTEFIDHPLYRALQKHDYIGYAKTLLNERRSASFPPYIHQAVLRAEAEYVQDALAFLSEAKAQASDNEHISLFDPTPAALTRKANVERALLLVQSPNRRVLQGFLQEWISRVYKMKANKLRWHLDVDPWEI
ncbi:primosomal protein N' [Sulfuriferula nivalis]|uniref:Replication restart protein PriA n=1 Tax=Sulfuriferula nivalis TaxID=2675298 RepID=A0A809SAZ5_9PROT|nr:primosomal protein N' [Sulfuriferula nivalis]BBP02353.1 primosomal protein N' [Sulfuriferula nivalis]